MQSLTRTSCSCMRWPPRRATCFCGWTRRTRTLPRSSARAPPGPAHTRHPTSSRPPHSFANSSTAYATCGYASCSIATSSRRTCSSSSRTPTRTRTRALSRARALSWAAPALIPWPTALLARRAYGSPTLASRVPSMVRPWPVPSAARPCTWRPRRCAGSPTAPPRRSGPWACVSSRCSPGGCLTAARQCPSYWPPSMRRHVASRPPCRACLPPRRSCSSQRFSLCPRRASASNRWRRMHSSVRRMHASTMHASPSTVPVQRPVQRPSARRQHQLCRRRCPQ